MRFLLLFADKISRDDWNRITMDVLEADPDLLDAFLHEPGPGGEIVLDLWSRWDSEARRFRSNSGEEYEDEQKEPDKAHPDDAWHGLEESSGSLLRRWFRSGIGDAVPLDPRVNPRSSI